MATNRNDANEPPARQHAPRLTTPLAAGSVPLTEDTEIPVRNICWRCNGRKTLDEVGYVRCDAPDCRKRCDLDRITNHGHGRRDVWVLACGHAQMSEFLDVRYDPCPECAGSGIQRGYKRLGDVLDWLEEQYATISQAVTAIRGKAL